MQVSRTMLLSLPGYSMSSGKKARYGSLSMPRDFCFQNLLHMYSRLLVLLHLHPPLMSTHTRPPELFLILEGQMRDLYNSTTYSIRCVLHRFPGKAASSSTNRISMLQ